MISKLNCYPSHDAKFVVAVVMLICPMHHVTTNDIGEVSGYTSMILPRLGGFVDVFELS